MPKSSQNRYYPRNTLKSVVENGNLCPTAWLVRYRCVHIDIRGVAVAVASALALILRSRVYVTTLLSESLYLNTSDIYVILLLLGIEYCISISSFSIAPAYALYCTAVVVLLSIV